MKATIKISGWDRLVKKLENYPKKVATPIVRKAIRSGTAVLRQEAKAATPVDEGVLKRAQDYKVSVKGFRGYGVTGANMDKLRAAHAADPSRPTNIDWLVEYGHVAPDGTFIPPSGHMRRAAREAMPLAEKRAIEVMRQGLRTLEGK